MYNFIYNIVEGKSENPINCNLSLYYVTLLCQLMDYCAIRSRKSIKFWQIVTILVKRPDILIRVEFLATLSLIFALCPRSNYSLPRHKIATLTDNDRSFQLIVYQILALSWSRDEGYHTVAWIWLFSLNIYICNLRQQSLQFPAPFTIIAKRCKSHVPPTALSPKLFARPFQRAGF